MQGRDFGYSVKIIDFNNDTSALTCEEDDFELKEILNLAS